MFSGEVYMQRSISEKNAETCPHGFYEFKMKIENQ